MSIQEEIKQFRAKFVFEYRKGSNFVEIVHCSPDKLEAFLYQALKRMQSAEKKRVLEIIGGMKKEGEPMQISCPKHRVGCLVYHFEMRLSEKEKGFNQSLSDLREKLVKV